MAQKYFFIFFSTNQTICHWKSFYVCSLTIPPLLSSIPIHTRDDDKFLKQNLLRLLKLFTLVSTSTCVAYKSDNTHNHNHHQGSDGSPHSRSRSMFCIYAIDCVYRKWNLVKCRHMFQFIYFHICTRSIYEFLGREKLEMELRVNINERLNERRFIFKWTNFY